MKFRLERLRSLPAALFTALLISGALSGCMRDMQDDSRYKPFEATDFFGDGRTARESVEGTVSVGGIKPDNAFLTGSTAEGEFVSEIPVAVTREFLERGRERFGIYCSHCHGLAGDGNGAVVLRGFSKLPPSYHETRLKLAPPGYFVYIPATGFGKMPSMADQVSPSDRWAIAAYIKTLQYSREASTADVPARVLAGLEKNGGPVDEDGAVVGTQKPAEQGHGAKH